MRIKARYNGTCPACREPIHAGETVEWHRGGKARHPRCTQRVAPAEDHDGTEAEYQKGLADGERYSSDRRIYGDVLAEQWALEDELARYNRGEE